MSKLGDGFDTKEHRRTKLSETRGNFRAFIFVHRDDGHNELADVHLPAKLRDFRARFNDIFHDRSDDVVHGTTCFDPDVTEATLLTVEIDVVMSRIEATLGQVRK